ncbi:TlpA family protein disulfide reductase [Chitinophaga sp. NPDC101104]|uniref:TlpA family protein disulfide reductase n=1 Tax=Chitinophaga sp. NPDC101104 TaxID=3390561 RepID=UPI003CFC850E
MKKAMLKPALLALLMTPAALMAQKANLPKQITVKGTVKFPTPEGQPKMIYLSRETFQGSKSPIVDSVELGKDLTYSFRVKQDHPGIYKINVMNWEYITFWSDADVKISSRGYDTAKMKIKIPHFTFVEGSHDNNFVNQMELNSTLGYLRMVDDYNQQYFAKEHKTKTGDSAWANYWVGRRRYNEPRDDQDQRDELMKRIYKDRPVYMYALRGAGSPHDTTQYAATLRQLDHLMQLYPWLSEAKNLKNTIIKNRAQMMKLQPGQPAPSISYPDHLGQLQGLEKYKGKYLLVDFWASWCGPCRQAIPKVKELYTAYKAQGLEVVSISIDTDKNAWKKAMADENMPWEQLLSDNKDKTMETYQFSGIPTLYLIDREGKIVTKFTGYSPEAETQIKSVIEKGLSAQPEGEKKVIKAMGMTSM